MGLLVDTELSALPLHSGSRQVPGSLKEGAQSLHSSSAGSGRDDEGAGLSPAA